MTEPIEKLWRDDKEAFLKALLESKIVGYYPYRTAHVPKPSERVEYGFDEPYPYVEIDAWIRKHKKPHDNHIVLVCEFADGKIRAIHKTDFYFIVGYDDTVKEA